MEIYPAMDLFEGEIVRLREGRFEERTVFGSDIAGTARSFREAGRSGSTSSTSRGRRRDSPATFPSSERCWTQDSGSNTAEVSGRRKTLTQPFQRGQKEFTQGACSLLTPPGRKHSSAVRGQSHPCGRHPERPGCRLRLAGNGGLLPGTARGRIDSFGFFPLSCHRRP